MTGRSNNRPSLAIVAPSAYPLGGVQTWLDYLVPGLEAAGWHVEVLLVHGPCSDANVYLRQHAFPRVRLVTNASGSREGRVRALKSAIELSNPDIVLCVNIVDVYEAVARMRLRNPGKPRVVMALHGLHARFYQDIARVHQALDGVIATNRLGVAAAVRLGGIPEARTHYSPCGVTVPDFVLPDFPDEELVLLYAGRFDDSEKRVMDLPLILAELERRKVACRLRLAGSGPDEAKLRSALSGFGEKVEFLGVLDEAAMRASFYRPGAILLIMSPSETGPLVAWEAMANGVALVTSRFVGMGLEASLQDGENCLVFPVGDADMAATAIARLNEPSLRHKLIESGYRLVRQRYSRDASVRAWDEALRRVLGQAALAGGWLPDAAPASGRLDRYFGAAMAESLRRLLGVRFQHVEAGGEWPHSYGNDEDEKFRETLSEMDSRTISA